MAHPSLEVLGLYGAVRDVIEVLGLPSLPTIHHLIIGPMDQAVYDPEERVAYAVTAWVARSPCVRRVTFARWSGTRVLDDLRSSSSAQDVLIDRVDLEGM